LPSLHTTGVPVHDPLAQASLVVQALLSLQEAPSAAFTRLQAPLVAQLPTLQTTLVGLQPAFTPVGVHLSQVPEMQNGLLVSLITQSGQETVEELQSVGITQIVGSTQKPFSQKLHAAEGENAFT